jgi:uncharacterized protein YegP (UPF0339 family)
MAAKFETFIDKAGEHRFRLKAGNGEIILASQGYNAKTGCANGIESVRTHAPEDANYERKQSDSGNFSFNLKSSNHQVIGTSQSYSTAAGRDNGIESVKKNAAEAEVVEAS